MRRQLYLHEAGFRCDKFLTSYFIDSQVFFRTFYFIYGIWQFVSELIEYYIVAIVHTGLHRFMGKWKLLPLSSVIILIYIFFITYYPSCSNAWLAHGRELREMWCCPPPKGLGTSLGPHGVVYTGQPHRDWLGKQWTNKVTMEPSPK